MVDPQPPMISHDIFRQDYRSRQRQEWYSGVTEAYQWARPRYPDPLLNRVCKQANLQSADSILEIGCGPGIASVALAERGLVVTAVEPSEEACKVARDRLQQFPRATVVHSTFEEFDLHQDTDSQLYDAVVAATSFHWLSPIIACSKISSCLKSEGALILLWSTPPQPTPEIFAWLQPVYVRYGLESLGAEQARTSRYYRENFEGYALMINQSGYFRPSQVEFNTHHSVYSIAKYLALLSTLSGYIALEASQRRCLLEDLGMILRENLRSSTFETTHWLASQVAIRL